MTRVAFCLDVHDDSNIDNGVDEVDEEKYGSDDDEMGTIDDRHLRSYKGSECDDYEVIGRTRRCNWDLHYDDFCGGAYHT